MLAALQTVGRLIDRRGTAPAMAEEVLRACAARADIDGAYPTQRFDDHVRAGRTGLRPDVVADARET